MREVGERWGGEVEGEEVEGGIEDLQSRQACLIRLDSCGSCLH